MGPGIYDITFYPDSKRWDMFPITGTIGHKLNYVYHVPRPSWGPEYYYVYLDSTGNIPAYIRGANMIEEAMKNG
jgi:hypothetical protein